jgi:hypothetical protein
MYIFYCGREETLPSLGEVSSYKNITEACRWKSGVSIQENNATYYFYFCAINIRTGIIPTNCMPGANFWWLLPSRPHKIPTGFVTFSCSGGVWINSFQNFLTVLNEKWWNMQYRQLCIRLKYEKYFTLLMTLIISLHVSGRYDYRFYTLTLFHIIIKTFLIYSTNTLKKYF